MSNRISFTARPDHIITGIGQAKICPCKKMFVRSVANFFKEIESQMRTGNDMPDTFVYHLDKPTEIPEKLKLLAVKGTTFEEIDNILSKDTFSCNGKKCGGTGNKKAFIQNILTRFGIENPNTIELTR